MSDALPFEGAAADEPFIPREHHQFFAEDLVGAIVDVTYEEPRCTYRVKVLKFVAKKGWHQVDSKGLSTWEGESFKDTIDFNDMYAAGQIEIVQEGKGLPAGRGGRGGGRGKRARSETPTRGGGIGVLPSGVNLCGRLVDVTYEDPPETFRVRVVSYDRKSGQHKIDSSGLSSWDGESFRDSIDIESLHRGGQVRLVQEDGDSASPEPQRSGRGGRGSRGGRGAPGGRRGGRAGAAGRGKARAEPWPGSMPMHRGAVNLDAGDVAPLAPRRPDSVGENLVGRVVDVALPNDASESGPYRLSIVGFNRASGCHIVEDLHHGSGEQNGPRSLDLQELARAGLVELVDGQEDLLQHSHVLVGEKVRFLHAGGKDTWISGTIVGWWPQDVLPPLAPARRNGEPRSALFVVEDMSGDQWQLSLGDAILAMFEMPPAQPSSRGPRVLEVFAGSCALSVAFWRLGVEVEMYDIRICERHDFRRDDALLKQLGSMDMDLVHLAPPDDFLMEPGFMARLLHALQTLHARSCAFVVESGERSALWNTQEMQEVAALEGVDSLSLDLQDFGAARSTPTQLLANCADWLEPALAAGLSGTGRSAARRQQANHPDGAQQYPQGFVEAYAKGAIQALRL